MNTIINLFIALIPIAGLIGITASSVKQSRRGIPGKKILTRNLVGFMVVLVVCGSLTFAVSAADTASAQDVQPVAQAEEPAPEEEEPAAQSNGLGLLAAALVTGLAGIGGGIAVAAGAPAAIAATSEDPKSFGKSLIFVALGESIALYGVVISILILNRV